MKYKEFKELQEILYQLASDDYQRLKISIKKEGIQNPITILRDGTVIDGMHRLKIAKELKIKKIPSIVKDIDKDKGFILGLSLNLARRHLSFEQKKEIIKILRKKGHTQEEIAGVVGITQQAISKLENTSITKSCNTCIIPDLRYRLSSKQKEEIYNKIEQAETQVKIASDYKISQQRISQIIKQTEREQKIIKQRENIKNLIAPEGLYDVIVIDPPWPYGTEYHPEGRRVASPYPEMSIEEIKQIRIPYTKDCILWLWTTNAFLRLAFEILEIWGFEYKNMATWVKDKIGTGYWLRGKTEHCLLATKGNPPFNGSKETTVIFGQRREHSRKPEEFYNLVEKTCKGKKLDYFGRQTRENWEIYGTGF